MRERGLQNRSTPRIFIAATRQNDGKTTASLGLLSLLKQRFKRVGYMKPIGQRYVEVEGVKVDEDTLLVNDTYHPNLPLDAMSPVAIDAGFTRHYLSGGNPREIEQKVLTGFNRAAWEQEFVVVEGSGHAGVGSVFHMSNAQVASLLDCKVVLVSRGGVGGPLDEISLNLALFEKYGVDVIGAILNKVLPDKIESLRPYAELGLQRLGLPLLGIIPYSRELKMPTLGQICADVKGTWLAGEENRRLRVGRISIGTASSKNAERYMDPECLLVTAGDREDLILSVMGAESDSDRPPVAGVVLTLGLVPPAGLIKLMKQRKIPFISTDRDSYEVVSIINRMTIKTEPGDHQKIDLIQNLFEEHIDVEHIIESAGMPDETGELPFE
jgi:BioD-like phosphotransacetylase family protein